jgi:predicted SAM-dependent methyltransferase
MMFDIGCGENKKGDVGVGIRKTKSVDTVADARCFLSGVSLLTTFFSSHLVEHFSHREVENAVNGWIRILKLGGVFKIKCPALRARSFLFFLEFYLAEREGHLRRARLCYELPWYAFSFGILKRMLESCGGQERRRIVKGHKGVPFLPDGLHV